MRIDTKPFGEIEVDSRQRISFPHGLFGFEHCNEFALLDSAQPPFYWLQSVEEADIAFVLIDPKFFRPDYSIDLPASELEEVELDGTDEALIFSIVTIPEDQARMTANLQGPIIINGRHRIGRQAISTNPNWRVRHFILEELAAVRNRAC